MNSIELVIDTLHILINVTFYFTFQIRKERIREIKTKIFFSKAHKVSYWEKKQKIVSILKSIRSQQIKSINLNHSLI